VRPCNKGKGREEEGRKGSGEAERERKIIQKVSTEENEKSLNNLHTLVYVVPELTQFQFCLFEYYDNKEMNVCSNRLQPSLPASRQTRGTFFILVIGQPS
jgi:hypothetical protein